MSSTTSSIKTPPMTGRHRTRAIAAATIGNALEWFDIAIYALFAVYIGQNFFPAADPGVELIQTFAVFGVSYLIRPLGGLILGAYADKHGRKAALVWTIRLMVVGTALLAVMPNYDSIGILAPIGIILARLIQGFAAGGEFGAATSFLVEQDGEKEEPDADSQHEHHTARYPRLIMSSSAKPSNSQRRVPSGSSRAGGIPSRIAAMASRWAASIVTGISASEWDP